MGMSRLITSPPRLPGVTPKRLYQIEVTCPKGRFSRHFPNFSKYWACLKLFRIAAVYFGVFDLEKLGTSAENLP